MKDLQYNQSNNVNVRINKSIKREKKIKFGFFSTSVQ